LRNVSELKINVLVDGPKDITGVARHMMPVKRLSLTNFKTGIVRAAREKTLRVGLKKDETMKKWAESSWGKKVAAKAARAEMNDFERFKVMRARCKRSRAVKQSMLKKK